MNKEITSSYLEEMLMECISKSIKEAFKEYRENKNDLYSIYKKNKL